MRRDVRATGALLICLIALSACESEDTERRALLATEAAQRLVGTWDADFVPDPRSGVRRAAEVRGMLAFTTDLHGPASTPELRGITHEGTYDVDFAPLGFTTGVADAPATAVARVVPGTGVDSLQAVLSPGTERFAVRMAGEFAGDSAWGSWSAWSHGPGGGTGRFVMRRRVIRP